MRRAAAIACAALGAAAFAGTAVAAVPAPRPISVDPFSGAQHETAVEPDNLAWGNTVVSVFQVGRYVGGGAAGIGWSTSTDGGATWSSGVLPGLTAQGSAPGPYTAVSDPVVAYDRVHAVWLASVLALTGGGAATESEVVTSRSADGITWSAPVVTAPNESRFAHDKNWLVCDTGSASPFAGRCYTLWSDADRGSVLGISISTDGGLSWSPPRAVGNVRGTGWQPLVRPDGVLVVPFLDDQGVQAVRSTDGGARFSSSVQVGPALGDDPIGVRAPPLPSAEIDGAGRVFVAWADCALRSGCGGPGAAEPPNELLLASSADGVRWTPPARVPVGAAAAGLEHFVPGLGVDTATSGGGARLGLAYYTLAPAGCAPAVCVLRPWFVGSRDAGRSWSVPAPLAGPTRLANLALSNRGRFVGDYISTAFAAGGVAVPVFSTALAPFDGRFHQGVLATAIPPAAVVPLPPVAPALGRLGVTPARPRAGRRFAVSARVTGTGSARTVASCTLRVGGSPLRPLARSVGSGRVTCSWRIPPGAAGRRASGSIAVTAGGRTARRSFSYVVAASVRARNGR